MHLKALNVLKHSLFFFPLTGLRPKTILILGVIKNDFFFKIHYYVNIYLIQLFSKRFSNLSIIFRLTFKLSLFFERV